MHFELFEEEKSLISFGGIFSGCGAKGNFCEVEICN
jgi:hypothetical protein